MKTCNNCNTSNEDDVVKCGHCNMTGNFTFTSDTQVSPVATKASLACRNCGSPDPGEAAKCTHCNFPLPLSRNTAITQDEFPILTPKVNLRVG